MVKTRHRILVFLAVFMITILLCTTLAIAQETCIISATDIDSDGQSLVTVTVANGTINAYKLWNVYMGQACGTGGQWVNATPTDITYDFFNTTPQTTTRYNLCAVLNIFGTHSGAGGPIVNPGNQSNSSSGNQSNSSVTENFDVSCSQIIAYTVGGASLPNASNETTPATPGTETPATQDEEEKKDEGGSSALPWILGGVGLLGLLGLMKLLNNKNAAAKKAEEAAKQPAGAPGTAPGVKAPGKPGDAAKPGAPEKIDSADAKKVCDTVEAELKSPYGVSENTVKLANETLKKAAPLPKPKEVAITDIGMKADELANSVIQPKIDEWDKKLPKVLETPDICNIAYQNTPLRDITDTVLAGMVASTQAPELKSIFDSDHFLRGQGNTERSFLPPNPETWFFQCDDKFCPSSKEAKPEKCKDKECPSPCSESSKVCPLKVESKQEKQGTQQQSTPDLPEPAMFTRTGDSIQQVSQPEVSAADMPSSGYWNIPGEISDPGCGRIFIPGDPSKQELLGYQNLYYIIPRVSTSAERLAYTSSAEFQRQVSQGKGLTRKQMIDRYPAPLPGESSCASTSAAGGVVAIDSLSSITGASTLKPTIRTVGEGQQQITPVTLKAGDIVQLTNTNQFKIRYLVTGNKVVGGYYEVVNLENNKVETFNTIGKMDYQVDRSSAGAALLRQYNNPQQPQQASGAEQSAIPAGAATADTAATQAQPTGDQGAQTAIPQGQGSQATPGSSATPAVPAKPATPPTTLSTKGIGEPKTGDKTCGHGCCLIAFGNDFDNTKKNYNGNSDVKYGDKLAEKCMAAPDARRVDPSKEKYGCCEITERDTVSSINKVNKGLPGYQDYKPKVDRETAPQPPAGALVAAATRAIFIDSITGNMVAVTGMADAEVPQRVSISTQTAGRVLPEALSPTAYARLDISGAALPKGVDYLYLKKQSDNSYKVYGNSNWASDPELGTLDTNGNLKSTNSEFKIPDYARALQPTEIQKAYDDVISGGTEVPAAYKINPVSQQAQQGCAGGVCNLPISRPANTPLAPGETSPVPVPGPENQSSPAISQQPRPGTGPQQQAAQSAPAATAENACGDSYNKAVQACNALKSAVASSVAAAKLAPNPNLKTTIMNQLKQFNSQAAESLKSCRNSCKQVNKDCRSKTESCATKAGSKTENWLGNLKQKDYTESVPLQEVKGEAKNLSWTQLGCYDSVNGMNKVAMDKNQYNALGSDSCEGKLMKADFLNNYHTPAELEPKLKNLKYIPIEDNSLLGPRGITPESMAFRITQGQETNPLRYNLLNSPQNNMAYGNENVQKALADRFQKEGLKGHYTDGLKDNRYVWEGLDAYRKKPGNSFTPQMNNKMNNYIDERLKKTVGLGEQKAQQPGERAAQDTAASQTAKSTVPGDAEFRKRADVKIASDGNSYKKSNWGTTQSTPFFDYTTPQRLSELSAGKTVTARVSEDWCPGCVQKGNSGVIIDTVMARQMGWKGGSIPAEIKVKDGKIVQ